MARWKIEFHGSSEVEADEQWEAEMKASDEFDPSYHAQVVCLDPMCDYCGERPATVTSPYWNDGDVCSRCENTLLEEHEEDSE